MDKTNKFMTKSRVAKLLVGLNMMLLMSLALWPFPVYASETDPEGNTDVGAVSVSYQVVDNRQDIVTIPTEPKSSPSSNSVPNTGYGSQAIIYVILLTATSGLYLLSTARLQSKSDV